MKPILLMTWSFHGCDQDADHSDSPGSLCRAVETRSHLPHSSGRFFPPAKDQGQGTGKRVDVFLPFWWVKVRVLRWKGDSLDVEL